MATPSEKLAESLIILKKLQENGKVAIKSSELSRAHRERLVKNNFITEVLKGWYIAIPPDEQKGDSTSWYASYWQFCSDYLNARYEDTYCLSQDQSLQIHAGNWTIPNQLLIRSQKGPNGKTPLPHNTSLFSVKSPLPNTAEIRKINGLRVLTLASALIHCSTVMFAKFPIDVRAALSMIKDSSDILGLLLDGGHSTIAGRLAGAFRNNKQGKIADDILGTMQRAGYDVREINPFIDEISEGINFNILSPYVTRIKLMWMDMRDSVIDQFPKPPGIPKEHEMYMKQVEEIYATDAYHSLSIEKYKVTPELIDRVQSGDWDISGNEEDSKQRDALAARGYWQASQEVRDSIKRILRGENAGIVFEKDHRNWYTELFAPCVAANLLKPSDLAGYRNQQVYISKSRHVPLNNEAVRDAMPTLIELLANESEPSVRAVLGHFIFVYIHPYMDGNGRIGRFLMNAMLSSGGYPWTVIPLENRNVYMKSLEKASVNGDINDFTKFISHLVNEGLKGTPIAT